MTLVWTVTAILVLAANAVSAVYYLSRGCRLLPVANSAAALFLLCELAGIVR